MSGNWRQSKTQGEPAESNEVHGVTVAEAMVYHRRGYCIIPIRWGTKKPAIETWWQFQSCRPTDDEVRKWFGGKEAVGIAVLLGEASGGLVVRDFDDPEVFTRWAAAHPDLAARLPTVETSGGRRHVYFRSTPEAMQSARLAMGKPDGNGAIKVDGGELRGGSGCYCVAPPSVHPDGHRYRWAAPWSEAPPALDDVPIVPDLVSAGFCGTVTEPTDTLSQQSRRSEQSVRSTPSGQSELSGQKLWVGDEVGGENGTNGAADQPPVDELLSENVQRAILDSLPDRSGVRNDLVLDFARRLKATELADRPAKALKGIFQRWFELARPHIRTKSYTVNWFQFTRDWGRVKFPKGSNPMANIVAKVKSAPLPKVAIDYDVPALQLLIAVCRELQRLARDGPFFLATTTAVAMLAAEGYTVERMQVWRWLEGLDRDDVIRIVGRGNRTRANRYRYLPKIEEPHA